TYWIGREFWGRGIATQALAVLLSAVKTRPLYARAAKDNIASLRVLEKCGFTITGYERGFANARGEEIEEVVLELQAEAQEVRAKSAEPSPPAAVAPDGAGRSGFSGLQGFAARPAGEL